jgi:hypothetical protein
MSAGDRYTAKKLKEARAAIRDTTNFTDPNAGQTGWPEIPIMAPQSQEGLLEACMKRWMAQKTELERPDDVYSGMPTQPICSTRIPKR